jgi:MFS transporter, OFA family, oxalate/formate antiporter
MAPSQNFVFTLFVPHMVKDLGISISTLALSYGLATLSGTLLLPVAGRLLDRYGSRTVIVLVGVVFGAVTIAMSLVRDPITLALGLIFLRFFGYGAMLMICTTVVSHWFTRRRGLVGSLLSQGLSLGLIIFPALVAGMIDRDGWRSAWVELGILVLVILVPVSWLVIRNHPEDFGLFPDGAAAPPTVDEGYTDSWRPEEARRTGIYWLLVASSSTYSMIVSGLVFHHATLMAARGLDQMTTVQSLQVAALFTVLGGLLLGYTVDRFSPLRMVAILMLTLTMAVILAMTTRTYAQTMLYAAFTGTVTGGFRVLDAVVWARYFGRRHLGAIRGATLVGTVAGTALGAYPLALSLDLTGSYTLGLTILLVLPVSLIIFTLFVKPPVKATPVTS